MGVLDGKVSIVTGAGRLRGIGRAAAVALAGLGADVVVTGTGRPPESFPEDEKAIGWGDIESTAGQVRALGRQALAIRASVTDAEDCQRTVDAALTEFGRVDILVNNAALSRGQDRVPIAELSEEIWNRVLNVKMTGTFLMSRAVTPVMIRQATGGAIINISSIAGKRGLVNTTAYCAANAGIIGFTQALAKELAPHNIRVNAVCPGLTDTSRMDDLGRGEQWQSRIAAMIPLGRAATDDDVGRLIAWLAAPDASYITGQAISIDGGVTS